MKYLVLLLIVVAVLWLMRSGRGAGTGSKDASGAAPSQAPARRGAEPGLQQVVACSHCGVHLPRSEALTGSGGRLYCSESHRHLQEGKA
ncbi:PP0621 family protein [Methylibium rhizosphaerae]|uniref:PP0621 family protein n=1 Tax=Methylibium rhizosphaerae TaxID=2570323 RepID=UPI001129B855|nr:PP0621 family protein [Methylibium rhizosphaerae]